MNDTVIKYVLSNNVPVKSSDKKSFSNLPSDCMFILKSFDCLTHFFGKYVSACGNCIIIHQDNVRNALIITFIYVN